MKCKDIVPGEYYAVGQDTGDSWASMSKTFVVCIGKWEKKRWRNNFSETGKRLVVGIATTTFWEQKEWKPDTIGAQRVWGTWEDWKKVKARREERREQQTADEEVRKAAAQKRLSELHSRILKLGVGKKAYSYENWDEAKGVSTKWYWGQVKVDLDLFESLLSRIENTVTDTENP